MPHRKRFKSPILLQGAAAVVLGADVKDRYTVRIRYSRLKREYTRSFVGSAYIKIPPLDEVELIEVSTDPKIEGRLEVHLVMDDMPGFRERFDYEPNEGPPPPEEIK